MILGQAAGTAACFAIDENAPVQNINISKLQAQLISDGQLLQSGGGVSGTNNSKSLLLDFGPTLVASQADMLNSPAHALGGLSSSQTNWNTGLIADTSSGLIYGNGSAATGVAIDMGRSLAGGSSINFNDNGFLTGALGGQVNTGIYGGNSPITDGFYGGTGGANALAVGLRINGLAAGVYTVYIAGRNTSTSSAVPQLFYCTNGASATNFSFPTAPSIQQANSSPAITGAFVRGDNGNYITITLGAGDSLYVVAAGTASNDMRGFLNSVEVVSGLPAPAGNLPAVNVWPTDATAARRGIQPGIVTVSRTGNTNASLNINLATSGTAVSGVDYHPISTSFSLPPGVDATNINILPYTNSQPVGDKTVIVVLLTSALYSIGNLSSATVTINDTPIDDWRLQYFGTSATNPAIAGDAAGPAADGIPNLLKYALGLNPVLASPASLISPLLAANGYFEISFTRLDPPPPDVMYQIESSNDLVSWCTNQCLITEAIGFNSNNTATVVYQGLNPATRDTAGFVRLRVSEQ